MSAAEVTITPLSDTPPGSAAPRDPSVPEKEQTRQRREREFKPLFEYLNKTCEAVYELNKTERMDVYRVMVKSHAMYGGSMVGTVNEKLQWVRTDRPEDKIYTVPLYQTHCDTALVEVCRSRTELNVEASAEDDPADKEAAEFAKTRVELFRKRKMSAFFSIREGQFLILSGSALRYTAPVADPLAGYERIPLSKARNVEALPGVAACVYCGLPVKGAPDEQGNVSEPCANCGGKRAKKVEPKPFEARVVERYAKVPNADVRVESVDPLEVNVSFSARKISDSPYVQRRRRVIRAKLEEKFDTDIPSTGVKDPGLRMQRQMETGQPAWGENDAAESRVREGGEQFEEIEFEQTWLDACLYHDYVLPEDAKLPNGKIIPKGTRLLRLHPNGVCVSRAGSKILDLRGEDKNKHWTGIPFRLKPTQFYGGGFEHLLPSQEQANILRSLQFVDVHYNAVRREFVNTQSGLTSEDLSGDPSEAIEVNVDLQYPADHAYAQSAGQTSLQHTMPLADEIASDMVNSAGTFSPTGESDQQKLMGTATGANLMREMQTGRLSPALWLRSEADEEQAFQVLELEQRYLSRSQFEKLKGKHGTRAVERFLKMNVRIDLKIEAVPGSWMPQSEAQRVANTEAYVGLVMKAKQGLPDEVLALAADAYRVPFEIAEYTLTKKLARETIERLQAVSAFLEKEGYAGAQYAPVVWETSGCKVNEVLDNHDALIDECRDWHLSDEGRQASPLLNASVDYYVEQLLNAKKEYAARLASDMGEVETAGQVPGQIGQMIAGQVQNEQMAGDQTAQAEQALQSQAAVADLEAAKRGQELEDEGASLELEKEGKAVEQQDREHKVGLGMLEREHKAAQQPSA